jgi:hypothetical protein
MKLSGDAWEGCGTSTAALKLAVVATTGYGIYLPNSLDCAGLSLKLSFPLFQPSL